MSGKPIQNCEVRFQFKCPKQWEALGVTEDPGVRSCGQCQKSVYLCQSESEVLGHARQGHCVAVPARVLAARERLDDSERAAVLAAQHGVPVISLREHPLNPDLLRWVTMEVARKHCLVPVSREGVRLVVAMSDPSRFEALEEVMFLTGCQVEVVVASRREIEEALEQTRPFPEHVEVGVSLIDEPEPPEPSTPVGHLIQLVLFEAHRRKAEQVRIEATPSALVIHQLVEGTPRNTTHMPLKLREELLHVLREQSGARAEQPGRLELRFRMRSVFFEVHFHLTERGEEVVLHRLPKAG